MSKHLEEILQYVKLHPELYDVLDRDYKNIKIKDKLWNEIGAQINEEGEAVKKKWKNLKDSYAKHLKALSNNDPKNESVYRYKTWPWAKKMDYFKPYLKYSRKKDSTENPINSSNNSDEEIETKYHEIVQVNVPETVIDMPTPELASKRKRGNFEKRTPITYLQSFQDTTENDYCTISTNDPTELIFLGYAKSIRKFSPKRQSIIKLKIAKLIMEEELLQQVEDENEKDQTELCNYDQSSNSNQ